MVGVVQCGDCEQNSTGLIVSFIVHNSHCHTRLLNHEKLIIHNFFIRRFVSFAHFLSFRYGSMVTDVPQILSHTFYNGKNHWRKISIKTPNKTIESCITMCYGVTCFYTFLHFASIFLYFFRFQLAQRCVRACYC